MGWLEHLQDARASYTYLVSEIVPGPQSLSYFVPATLLPIALMVPPEILSRKQLMSTILPVIYACTAHAWMAMGGVDVCSVDLVLWCTFFIGLSDPRAAFRRLRRSEGCKRSDIAGSLVNGADPYELQGIESEGYHSEDQSAKVNGKETQLQTSPTGTVGTVGSIGNQYPPATGLAVHEERYPALLVPRLRWVLTLIASTRLHAWKTNNPSHDRKQLSQLSRPPPSRMRFSLALTPKILLNILILHPLVTQLALWDPSITCISPPPSPSPFPPFTIRILRTLIPAPVLTPLTHALYAYTALTTVFVSTAPLVCLSNYALGFPADDWSPHTLPAYFGPFRAVLDRGLAGLWGQWWHQYMRVMASAPGVALADLLLGRAPETPGRSAAKAPERPRTGAAPSPNRDRKQPANTPKAESRRRRLRYVVVTLTAFSLSGLTHTGMIPPSHPAATWLRAKVWFFFFAQGVGVLLETFLLPGPPEGGDGGGNQKQEGARRKNLRRALTLTWVLSFLCVTNPLLHQAFDELGWYKLWPPLPPWGVPGSLLPEDSKAVGRWTGGVRMLKGFLNGSWIP